MSNYGKKAYDPALDENTYNSSVQSSPFYNYEQNRTAFNQQSYQPAINYEQGILSGKTPTASSQIAAQQQASLAEANQAQANSVRGGVGAGNAAKYAQAGTATGNAGIAASQKVAGQQERAAAAGALGNMGYMYGMNQIGAENGALNRQLAPNQNLANQANIDMSNEAQDVNEISSYANAIGTMAGGAAKSDARAKTDIRPQGIGGSTSNRTDVARAAEIVHGRKRRAV